MHSGWTTVAWGGASLYALYRIVARLAGSTDLPLGNCLVIEAVLIPLFMMISDGFLLAWLLTELRNAGHDGGGEDRLDVRAGDRALARCGAGVRRGLTGSLPGDIRLAGLGILADLRQRDGPRRLFPVAARLGPDRHAGGLARGARLDRRRRLEPGHDPGGARRLPAGSCRGGRAPGRGDGDGRRGDGRGHRGRLRHRLAPAGAELGPRRGR